MDKILAILDFLDAIAHMFASHPVLGPAAQQYTAATAPPTESNTEGNSIASANNSMTPEQRAEILAVLQSTK